MRQGLIIVNDSRESETVVRFFTAMIINKDPNTIRDWRDEYVTVNEKEFREELKLLAMPLVHEMSVMRAIELPDGREFPVIMRKVHILLLAPPIGFIIFGQPSTALLVKDGDRLYLGFKGPSPETGDKIVVTIRSRVEDTLTIPFTPAIARFIFIGDVIETVIDNYGRAKGLRR
jgi:hypothetical protein